MSNGTHPYAVLHGEIQGQSRAGADVLVPLIVETFAPMSVLDIGCGRGWFLDACRQHGVTRVLGIDGDYVTPADLCIAPDEYRPEDLSAGCTVDERFDVAISLEVAEHLPAPAGDALVAALVRCAPVVVFSAAIPGQGGTEHVNEQWQSYWAERFAAHGYRPVDLLRPQVWGDDRVPWYYRQNVVVYVARDAEAFADLPDAGMLDLVHPKLYRSKANGVEAYRRRSVRARGGQVWRATRRRLANRR